MSTVSLRGYAVESARAGLGAWTRVARSEGAQIQDILNLLEERTRALRLERQVLEVLAESRGEYL